MLEKIENLIKMVGQTYPKTDEEGNYIECFYPAYFLYDHLPRFKYEDLPTNLLEACEFINTKALESCQKISFEELEKGDLILFGNKNKLPHLAVFLGDMKIFHANSRNVFEITRLKNYSYFAIGGYRCHQ